MASTTGRDLIAGCREWVRENGAPGATIRENTARAPVVGLPAPTGSCGRCPPRHLPHGRALIDASGVGAAEAAVRPLREDGADIIAAVDGVVRQPRLRLARGQPPARSQQPRQRLAGRWAGVRAAATGWAHWRPPARPRRARRRRARRWARVPSSRSWAGQSRAGARAGFTARVMSCAASCWLATNSTTSCSLPGPGAELWLLGGPAGGHLARSRPPRRRRARCGARVPSCGYQASQLAATCLIATNSTAVNSSVGRVPSCGYRTGQTRAGARGGLYGPRDELRSLVLARDELDDGVLVAEPGAELVAPGRASWRQSRSVATTPSATCSLLGSGAELCLRDGPASGHLARLPSPRRRRAR